MTRNSQPKPPKPDPCKLSSQNNIQSPIGVNTLHDSELQKLCPIHRTVSSCDEWEDIHSQPKSHVLRTNF